MACDFCGDEVLVGCDDVDDDVAGMWFFCCCCCCFCWRGDWWICIGGGVGVEVT